MTVIQSYEMKQEPEFPFLLLDAESHSPGLARPE